MDLVSRIWLKDTKHSFRRYVLLLEDLFISMLLFHFQCYLFSDRATFMKSSKRSRHNPVTLVSGDQPSHLNTWKVVAHDPQFRMELEYSDVPVSTVVLGGNTFTFSFFLVK